MGAEPAQPTPSAAAAVTAEQAQDLIDAVLGTMTWRTSSPCSPLVFHWTPLIRKAAQNVNATNLEKNTPLHWACLNGHIEVIKALICAGASVSALNSHEKTPMDEAVTKGKMDVIDAIGAAAAQAELDGVTVS
ncbi:uncharacterized protein LOC133890892 [Phragmites australis]|uniref:uncharacterized protein LOC133890892 n=1 Tax=Phragmites australis TaxID=29695 RepID=UPI002D76F2DB|nr:uncharacterized protein LOC133890892 [Phragmites australis]